MDTRHTFLYHQADKLDLAGVCNSYSEEEIKAML